MADTDSRGWFENLCRFKRDHPELCKDCKETLCGYGNCKMPKFKGEL